MLAIMQTRLGRRNASGMTTAGGTVGNRTPSRVPLVGLPASAQGAVRPFDRHDFFRPYRGFYPHRAEALFNL